MGGLSASQAQTSSYNATTTIDERIAAADQAVAVRGGGDASETNVNYSISTMDTELIRDLALGVGDLTKNIAANSNQLATDAILKISDVKSTGLTEGATDLQKTVLLGLGLGVLALFGFALMKR